MEKYFEEDKAESITKTSDLNENPSGQLDTLTDEQIIPIKEERYSISKESVVEDVKIEKRLITKNKKIAVPFLNEEIYVNGRQLRSYDKLKGNNILSKVTDRVKEGLDRATNEKKVLQYSLLEAHELKREIIPLFEDVKNANTNNKEIEKVIPIFGEEIVITKRRVKVGELVIKKNRVTMNNKIEIDTLKEEAAVKYPERN